MSISWKLSDLELFDHWRYSPLVFSLTMQSNLVFQRYDMFINELLDPFMIVLCDWSEL